MSDNSSTAPTPKLGIGYYVLAEHILVKIHGIIWDSGPNRWCYDLEVVADKTKHFSSLTRHPVPIEIIDRLMTEDVYKPLSNDQRRTIEVLFDTATEAEGSSWEQQLTSNPHVSVADGIQGEGDSEDEF